MSGMARIPSPGVLPAGSAAWNEGAGNTLLKPPPESIQPTSRWPGNAPQLAGGETLFTVVPVAASTHSYVPPTAVTSGSEAGHWTAGSGSSVGFLVGCFLKPALPSSPVDASTATWLAWAARNAPRRVGRER